MGVVKVVQLNDFTVGAARRLYTCIQVNETQWGYRDGVKSKGNKIGMDYTHGAVG